MAIQESPIALVAGTAGFVNAVTNPTDRTVTLIIQNTSGVNVYFGGSSVSTASCYLAPGEKMAVDVGPNSKLYLLASVNVTLPCVVVGE